MGLLDGKVAIVTGAGGGRVDPRDVASATGRQRGRQRPRRCS